MDLLHGSLANYFDMQEIYSSISSIGSRVVPGSYKTSAFDAYRLAVIRGDQIWL